MQSEERVEVVAFGFGDNLAVVVLVIAVDHHAVKAGELADCARGGVVELGQRGGAVEVVDGTARGLVGVRERERPFAVGDLDFDQQGAARLPAQDRVEFAWLTGDVDHALERVALAQIASRRRRLLDASGLVGADQE